MLNYVHTTELTQMDCPLKWYFHRLALGEGLMPKKKSLPLAFGDAFHQALNTYVRNNIEDPQRTPKEAYLKFYEVAAVWDEDNINATSDEVEEAKYLGLQMMEYYCESYLPNCPLVFCMSEQKFNVPIVHPTTLQKVGELRGTFDGIIQFNNAFWLLEFKTSKRAWSVHKMLNASQTILYCHAGAQIFPQPLAGVFYTIFQKKAPTPPIMLKNGGLSKNKNQDTTFELYLKAIEDNNLCLEEYADFLDMLEHKPNPFIQTEHITLTKEIMETAAVDLYKQFMLMNYFAKNPEMVFPIKSWAACSFCDYVDLCELRCNKENWKLLAAQNYIPNERYLKEEKND